MINALFLNYIAHIVYNFCPDTPLEIWRKEDAVSTRERIADFGQPYIAMTPGISGALST
jgi:hypothetical protein